MHDQLSATRSYVAALATPVVQHHVTVSAPTQGTPATTERATTPHHRRRWGMAVALAVAGLATVVTLSTGQSAHADDSTDSLPSWPGSTTSDCGVTDPSDPGNCAPNGQVYDDNGQAVPQPRSPHTRNEDEPGWDALRHGNKCGAINNDPGQPVVCANKRAARAYLATRDRYGMGFRRVLLAGSQYTSRPDSGVRNVSGPTALCRDGIRTFSPRSIACTRHGGVTRWLR